MRAVLWCAAAVLWFYEASLWITVWLYYGLFLAVRAGIRVAAPAIAARRARPPQLPIGQPYVAPPEPEDARPSQW